MTGDSLISPLDLRMAACSDLGRSALRVVRPVLDTFWSSRSLLGKAAADRSYG